MGKTVRKEYHLRQPDGKRQDQIIKWWNVAVEPPKPAQEEPEVCPEEFVLPTKQDYVEELKSLAYENPSEVSGWNGWHDEQISEADMDKLFEDTEDSEKP